ncbi:MAG: AEC family transporter, partial [Anaerolineae bacterium]
MSAFSAIFFNNILPAFLVIAAGVVLGKWLKVDKRSISRMAIYILTPSLILSSIIESTISISTFGRMFLYAIVLTAVLCILSWGVGKALRWSARTTDALILSVAFVNAGNFGLSMILLTFGEEGLQLATIFFVASNLVGNTVAAFFAARSKKGGWKALLQVFKLPGVYAFGLALLLRTLQVQLPTPIGSAVSLIGRGSVPVMLLLLGIQLSQTHLGKRYGEIAIGVFL